MFSIEQENQVRNATAIIFCQVLYKLNSSNPINSE